MKLRLVNRYSIGNGTKKEIDDFNKFYELEEARLNHEARAEEEWITEELTRVILKK